MPTEDKTRPLCPRCAKAVGILAVYSLPVAAADPGAPPARKDETVPVYACPHCRAILGVGGGSYIGGITIKT